MSPRRDQPDPAVSALVRERLAQILAESPPRRASGDQSNPPEVSRPAAREVPDVEVEQLPVADSRRFTRTHVAIVTSVALLALLWAGWSVLRAQPVVLATPTATTSAATGRPRPTSGPVVAASPSAGARTTIVVHVVGAVRKPGVVTLNERARVQDAVAAAGGLTARADPGQLNLAQVLLDGQQVRIGTRGRPAGEVRDGTGSTGSAEGTGTGSPGATLDLNSATAAQLDALPGVGPVTAQKILGWRTEHQRFTRVEELQEVPGIGPKTYAELAPLVRV